MIYKRFRIQIIIRISLLLISCFLLSFLFFKFENDYLVTKFTLFIFIILQTFSLIFYAERTNKKLSKFLSGIRQNDFTLTFNEKKIGQSFEELNTEFNNIINELKKTRTEKEEHYNYLLTVVQHVNIGILVFRRDGKVDLFNNAVRKLLKVGHLRTIEELRSAEHDLPDLLLHMKAGDKMLLKLFIDDELIQLSINATEFRMHGEEYILVSLQNIHPELEEKEVESWQRLIRVLTHEIMNSITPISSLASTMQEMMTDSETGKNIAKQLPEEDLDVILSALGTIESRSHGLMNFMELYRNLTRIPKPNFRYFNVRQLCNRMYELMKPKFDTFNIQCECKVFPEELMVLADPDLIDQVMINLVLNAIDTVKDRPNPRIVITASTNLYSRITIDIADNGHGIKLDMLDKIFMPFFTSKKEGSGIGLSLSRQIMQMHKGSISVKSKPDEGSVFTLIF